MTSGFQQNLVDVPVEAVCHQQKHSFPKVAELVEVVGLETGLVEVVGLEHPLHPKASWVARTVVLGEGS